MFVAPSPWLAWDAQTTDSAPASSKLDWVSGVFIPVLLNIW
jgi:hypothetical protein